MSSDPFTELRYDEMREGHIGEDGTIYEWPFDGKYSLDPVALTGPHP